MSVIKGEILDIVIDLRKKSKTFGKVYKIRLSEKNAKSIFIPNGFAHGFLTLSDTSEFLYKTTDFYHPESERCIVWNDETLNINWPNDLNIQVSPKDLLGKSFKSIELFPVNNR